MAKNKKTTKETKVTEKASSVKLPSAQQLLMRSIAQLYKNKRVFLGILAIYGLLNLLLVHGLSGAFRLGLLKDTLSENFGELDKFTSGFALFGLLLSSAGESSEAGGVYQSILFIVVSLTLIYALRRSFKSSNKISIKESFYKGVAPLVPFTLVGLVVFLELLPFLIGISFYTTVKVEALISGAAEQIIWLMVLIGSSLLTTYLVSGSIFALYIVTLSDSTPVKALKTSHRLVKYRRVEVMRKLLFLPVLMLVAGAVILVPLIIIAAPLAEIIFLASTILVIAVFHSYLYRLYRELI